MQEKRRDSAHEMMWFKLKRKCRNPYSEEINRNADDVLPKSQTFQFGEINSKYSGCMSAGIPKCLSPGEGCTI